MQENNHSDGGRSDLHEFESPTNKDLLAVITQINERTRVIESTIKSQSSAFVINDLGTPDYDGHRKSHLKLENEARLVENYKKNVTETIVKWAAGILILVIVTGLGETIKNWLANGP